MFFCIALSMCYNPAMQVGEKIKLFRMMSGYTQADMAPLLGVHYRNLAMIESHRFKPNIECRERLLKVLPLSQMWLTDNKRPIFSHEIVSFVVSPQKPVRFLNELEETVKHLFLKFLEENKPEISKCVVMEGVNIISFSLPESYLFIKCGSLLAVFLYTVNEAKIPITTTTYNSQSTGDRLIDNQPPYNSNMFIQKGLEIFGLKKELIENSIKQFEIYRKEQSNVVHEFTRIAPLIEICTIMEKHNLTVQDLENFAGSKWRSVC